eukprot:TRINITY_DN51639_c0_g5_i1.p1 TRINITY_DN51639_c0_g5~~TRINITY_DN51639_c0_g5_i1.p1  ORF type:complete len:992 (+),score=243.24 TRINITY_DN51639_c0_g5_i1:182-3157(+)
MLHTHCNPLAGALSVVFRRPHDVRARRAGKPFGAGILMRPGHVSAAIFLLIVRHSSAAHVARVEDYTSWDLLKELPSAALGGEGLDVLLHYARSQLEHLEEPFRRLQEQQSSSKYLDAEDERVKKLGNEKIEEFCGQGFAGKNSFKRDSSRYYLTEAVGGDNIILQAMKDAEGPDDLSSMANWQARITIGYIMRLAGALVILFFLPFCCFCCACTALPCCKCIRICRAKQSKLTSHGKKLICLLLVGGVAAGCVLAGTYAYAGYRMGANGFDNLSCTSAKLLVFSLQGSPESGFLGMFGLLELFEELGSLLTPGSSFLEGLMKILDKTERLPQAMLVWSSSLELYADMMANGANLRPEDALGNDLKHKCSACEPVGAAIGALAEAVASGGVGTIMAVRTMIEEKITGDGAAMLQQFVESAATPLLSMKLMMRTSVSSMLEGDMIPMIRVFLNGEEGASFSPAFVGLGVLIVLSLALSACGLLSVFCCFARETKSGVTKKTIVTRKTNPFNKATHRVACCTWCCAYAYTFLVLIIGWIVGVLLCFPLSSICLLLDEMNSTLLVDIGPGTGGAVTLDESEQSQVVGAMIDGCFAGCSDNQNIVDIVRVDGRTVREKLDTDVKKSILDTVNSAPATAVPKLSETDAFKTSTRTAKDTSMMAVMTVSPDDVAEFAEMAGDTRTFADSLQIYTMTGTHCLDKGVIYGIKTFTKNLQTYCSAKGIGGVTGIDTPFADCSTINPAFGGMSTLLATTVSTLTANCGMDAVCKKAKDFLEKKRSILASTKFRCDLFEDPDDPTQYCDVLATSPYYKKFDPDNGKLSCGKKTGTNKLIVKVKKRTCTADEYEAYMFEWADRLDDLVVMLETAIQTTQPAIMSGLVTFMKEEMFALMDRILDAASCAFLSVVYREFIDGFCFQGVVGIYLVAQSYVACGVFSVLLLLFTYSIWRHAIDNYNAWTPPKLYRGPKAEKKVGRQQRARRPNNAMSYQALGIIETE